ncbi:MAG: IclR family transcriptional regulator [Paracoccaceae bacterium]
MKKPHEHIAPRGRPRAFNDKTEQNTVQALDRALGMLAVLADTAGMPLTDLAGRAAMAPATAYRALITLQRHGMVEFDQQAQIWHVGPGAYRIGSAFLRRTRLSEAARHHMQDLMRTTGETANLGIEADDEVLFLTQVETHEAIRAFFPPGTKGPMHTSGIGKALLAWYPADRVRHILSRKGMAGYTPLSLTTETELLADLERTRARGYAVDDQERAHGMRCIAAPIFNAHGEPVAGLSVSGPSFRVDLDGAARIGALVRRAADRVSEAIGGVVPPQALT